MQKSGTDTSTISGRYTGFRLSEGQETATALALGSALLLVAVYHRKTPEFWALFSGPWMEAAKLPVLCFEYMNDLKQV